MIVLLKKITVAVVFFACAVAYGDEYRLDGIPNECIAVSYKSTQNKIFYSEILYRVLWLETKRTEKDFSGVWDADQDLLNWIVDSLSAHGFLGAKRIYDLSSLEVINAYHLERVKKVEFLTEKSEKDQKQYNLAFNEKEVSLTFQAIASDLLSKQCNYLLEFSANGINGFAVSRVTVSVKPNMRLVDVKSGDVLWSSRVSFGDQFRSGGDLTILEENNMEKTKEGLRNGISRFNFKEFKVNDRQEMPRKD